MNLIKNPELAQKIRISKDRTLVSLARISHEFKFNTKSHNTCILQLIKDKNNLNFSINSVNSVNPLIFNSNFKIFSNGNKKNN